ncbi:MAG: integration host factor subunit alpha [Termitinemataceae bacterium]|nr:MAG: integration host factor subunit alpha [Termitinemataceae bacterium]
MSAEKYSKARIVDRIYEDTGLNKCDIKLVFDSVFEIIKEALIGGCAVELRGFGTFTVRERKARKKARNPRTGEAVSAPAHNVATFKAGNELKQAVRPIKKSKSRTTVKRKSK